MLVLSSELEVEDVPRGNYYKLVGCLLLACIFHTLSRVQVHRYGFFIQRVLLNLKCILVVFLIILIHPKDCQIAISIDGAYVVRVAVKQFDDRLPEVPDSARLVVEAPLSPVDILIELDPGAA